MRLIAEPAQFGGDYSFYGLELGVIEPRVRQFPMLLGERSCPISGCSETPRKREIAFSTVSGLVTMAS